MDTTHDETDSTQSVCTPQRLCRRFRTCPRCAKIRQAKAGDLAEKLQSYFGPLYLTVLTPEMQTPEAIANIRQRWAHLSRVPAALWSVEEGDKRGTLHTNIIHPVCKPAKPRGAAIHTEPLRHAPRIAAAYITKREQIPDPGRYPGRTFGRCGHLLHFLALDENNPTIQAAAINELLNPPPTEPPRPIVWNKPPEAPRLTDAEYKEIAKRHLPNLAALAHMLKSSAPR